MYHFTPNLQGFLLHHYIHKPPQLLRLGISVQKLTNEYEPGDIYIFMFMDSKLGVKIWDNQGPGINKIDQYLKTHKRHYLQQTVYTICTAFESNKWYYANHEEVFLANDKNQDLLWKIKIPKNKRKEFLSKLEHMNINSFSLFQTEDALMEHIFISEGYIGGNL